MVFLFGLVVEEYYVVGIGECDWIVVVVLGMFEFG